MDWQARYYPLEVFVTLKAKIEDLIKSGDFRAVELVKDEINSVATPDLKAWASSHKDLFVPLVPEVQLEGAAIEAKYPDLIDVKSPYQSADAYVIAWANLQSGVVISQETSVNEKRNPAKRYYIPDVCRDLGIPCIHMLGLMRREKWTF